MSAKIYWSARAIAANRNFNHHFAAIVWEGVCPTSPIPLLRQNNRYFVTLGAFPSKENPADGDYGDLVFVGNNSGDAAEARSMINRASGSPRENYAPQQNEVRPPSGDGESFARTLIRMAIHYRHYTLQNRLAYDRLTLNSNSWNNSLFNAAGVPEQERRRLRNFAGWDVAEHQIIAREYFSS